MILLQQHYLQLPKFYHISYYSLRPELLVVLAFLGTFLLLCT
jgi:hypothetical protein